MPMAFVCIFAFKMDLSSVAGSIAVGYVSAATILAWKVYTSDWDSMARQAQAQAAPMLPYDFDEDDEYSSSSESDLSDDSEVF